MYDTSLDTTQKVVRLDASWSERYREFCQHIENLTIYGTWAFREFLIDLLGCTADYLGAVNAEGDLLAVLPLLSAGGTYGKVLNSLPFFGSYGGVLGDDAAARNALWGAYETKVRESGVAAATIVLSPFDEVAFERQYDFTDHRIGQFTSLSLGPDPAAALTRMIDSSSRRNLRKAESSGIEVSIDNAAMAEHEAIHRENMEAIGGRPKPTEFFARLPRYFKEGRDYNLYVARRDGAVVSSLLLFYTNSIVEYYIPGTRLDERPYQPSAAILFTAMLDASKNGYKVWNWGGTWRSQTGVLRFKRKWGAVDRRYDYYTSVNNSDLYDATVDQLSEAYPYFYVLPFDKLNA